METQTFPDLLKKLHTEQFTGETLIRWAQGHPRIVEFPNAPTRVVLDKTPVTVKT